MFLNEKPVSSTLEEGKQLVKNRKGVRKLNYWLAIIAAIFPLVQRAREIVRSGELGGHYRSFNSLGADEAGLLFLMSPGVDKKGAGPVSSQYLPRY